MNRQLVTIGDVLVVGEEATNPYAAERHLLFDERRDALHAFRERRETPGLAFWYAPTFGGAYRLTDPDEVRWGDESA